MPARIRSAALVLSALLLSLAAGPAFADASLAPSSVGDMAAIDAKVEALLAKMTLEEKVGQLNQYSSTFDITGPVPEGAQEQERYAQIESGQVGSMLNVLGTEATCKAQRLAVEGSRLGIPMIFGFDVIHGYRTIFPVPLGEAASWDLDAIETSARIAAVEASAAGVHWTFAPMVDIARDSRWGRIMEGAGEDPYLGSVVAAARVRGFQGDDLASKDTIAACAKHYAGYGFAEGGRDYNTADLSEHTLRNVVLPPFHAAVEAGVATLMNGFNEIGGVPVTGSVHLQRDILKGEWGFDGFVVSDWGSIGEMVPHGTAEDLEAAARQAIRAGSDMDMESVAYVAHLVELVNSGKVDVALVDDAVRRVLRVKFMLGLFDDPYGYCDAEREERLVGELGHDDHHAHAREVARKSIVLLKNDDGLLPLSKDIESLAVIGALADDKDTPLGSWRGTGVQGSAVSLLEGVRDAVTDASGIVHIKGPDLGVGDRSFVMELEINTSDTSGIDEAVAAATSADRVILVVGEEAFQTGEGRSQVDVGLAGVQQQLADAVLAANPNTVVVLMNGRPLAIPELAKQAPAIVEAWHLGSQAGHAIADVLFGDHNPSGKLPVSFPRHVGQEPLYYNHKNTGRPGRNDGMVFWSHYTDAPNTALFPFGHGLSYTTFEYSEPKLSSATISADQTVDVTVTVTNTGDRAGTEVVQLYVRDLVGSVTRPVKELKGFERIELAAGASQTVTFTLGADDLAFYTAEGTWQAEPGKFQAFVGGDSVNVKSASFSLE